MSPEIVDHSSASIDAARSLHQRIDRPNLMVKIQSPLPGSPPSKL